MSQNEMPACCVCGDWEVPRRVVLWGEEGQSVAVAVVCTDARWCQGRAAANKLGGLVGQPHPEGTQ